MRSLRISVRVVAVVAVVVVGLSCGGGGTPAPAALSSTWVAPAILAQVPADSPYLFATLDRLDDKIRRRLSHGLDQRIAELVKTASLFGTTDRSSLDPWLRGALVLVDELRGKDAMSWWQDFGFDPDGRVVIYGLSAWPVLRVELARPAHLRGLIERVLAAADVHPRRAKLDGRAYWSFGNADVTVVAAVLDREAVAAVVPTAALATVLPLVLGTQPPAHPLGATTIVTDLLARNHLTGALLAYIDLRRALAVLTGPTPGPLDAPLRALAGPMSPVCRTELDRLVSVLPRATFGYRRLDTAGFEAVGVFETLPSVVAALRRVRVAVPELTAPFAGHPLVAFGSGAKTDEFVAWMRGVSGDLHDHPFSCPWFDGINQLASKLAGEFATPLPPEARGMRGLAVVIDDMTISPLSIDGHVLLASDRAADVVSALTRALPGGTSLAIKPDGRPVEIPTQQLHLSIPPVHVAMTPDRLVIAMGATSALRATTHLASPTPRSSPLLMMAFDVRRMQALLASVGSKEAEDLDEFGNLGLSLDVVDTGLSLDVWGTWADPPPAPPSRPMTQP